MNNSNNRSRFEGTLAGQIGINILVCLIIIFSFGFAAPFALVLKYDYEAKNTFINNQQLEFDGTGIQLFGSWLKWSLLTIITFGIYGFWFSLNLKKWRTKHTSLVL
jgi:uncharacterized membrane protein YjgN (DUF898 family)